MGAEECAARSGVHWERLLTDACRAHLNLAGWAKIENFAPESECLFGHLQASEGCLESPPERVWGGSKFKTSPASGRDVARCER